MAPHPTMAVMRCEISNAPPEPCDAIAWAHLQAEAARCGVRALHTQVGVAGLALRLQMPQHAAASAAIPRSASQSPNTDHTPHTTPPHACTHLGLSSLERYSKRSTSSNSRGRTSLLKASTMLHPTLAPGRAACAARLSAPVLA